MDDEMEMKLDSICRICLQSDGDMVSIFDSDTTREISFNEKIMQCSNLEVAKNSPFPEQICQKCIDDLEIAFRFRMNCESSNAILQTYLEVYMDPEPPEDPETMTDDVLHHHNDDDNSMLFSEVKTEQPPVLEEEYQIEYLDDLNNPTKSFISMLKTGMVGAATPMPLHLIELPKFNSLEDQQLRKKYVNRNKAEVCELCGNTYRSKSILAIHMKRHAGEKAYGCEECDAKFVTRSGVTRHMRTHTGEKPYPCSICKRGFSDYSTRNRHERTHSGERPYICTTCGMAFTYNHVLTTHMLTHTGEKNYECDQCHKRFTKSYHLSQHKNVHLRAQGKPYKKYIRPKTIAGSLKRKGGTIIINPERSDDDAQVNRVNDDLMQVIDEASESEYEAIEIVLSP